MKTRSTSRSQGRQGDRASEGRLCENHEPMNKNPIQGRSGAVSWHNTAKPFVSARQVNGAVVWWRTAFLPGPTSPCGLRRVFEEISSPSAIARRATAEGHSSWRHEPECGGAQQNCRRIARVARAMRVRLRIRNAAVAARVHPTKGRTARERPNRVADGQSTDDA